MIRLRKSYPSYHIPLEVSGGKVVVWIIVCCLFLLLLALRLFQLQVKNQSLYLELSKNNHDRIVSLECPRGSIFDRNGVKLAEDLPTYHLYGNLKQTFTMMNSSLTRDQKLKQITSSLGKVFLVENQQLGDLLVKHQDQNNEFLVRSNLGSEEYARFNEKSFELPGFLIKEGYKRFYPKGSLLAHMIGYTRVISSEQKKLSAFVDYEETERIGKSGIELYYEKILHGKKGKKIQTINAFGTIIDEKMISEVVKGDNIYLTIDARLQEFSEETIKDHVGTVIVLDCRSGEILAAASNPTFDPNIFSGLLSDRLWNELQQKRAFYNIAVQGQYPPGSTFKPLLSLYALGKKIINPEDKLFCGGYINVPNLTEKYRCWVYPSKHGLLNLKEALKLSCDVFFYELGRRCQIEDLLRYVKQFGLAKRTGIDIDEVEEMEGFLGNPTWKKKQEGYPWFDGDSMNLGIGQGFIDVTPMQMAKIYAQIGNGGKSIVPHLLKKTSKNVLFMDTLSQYQKEQLSLNLSPDPQHFRDIRDDLFAVTEAGGTAPGLYNSLVKISAKTGTAEGAPGKGGKSKQHLWLSTFSPTDNPEIAAIMLFEDSDLEFGGMLAPYLKKIILKYVELTHIAGGNDA